MPKVKVADYAKHRGIAERSVRRYLADGLIPKTAIINKGRFIFIDQLKADRALAKHATTRKQLLDGKEDKTHAPGKATPAQQIQTSEKAGTAGLSFHDARTLAQRYKAALLRLELDEKTGRLVDAEQVKISAFNRARQLRDALLNIPDRTGPILAAETDEAKVSEILTHELKAALEELTRG